MLFEKFFNTISAWLPGDIGATNLQALASVDPDRIYVENIRVAFSVSHRSAVRLCETAVRQGLFVRLVEVECPDGSIAASATREVDLPATVRCPVASGAFLDEVEIPTTDLKKNTFYRLLHDPTRDAETQSSAA